MDGSDSGTLGQEPEEGKQGSVVIVILSPAPVVGLSFSGTGDGQLIPMGSVALG